MADEPVVLNFAAMIYNTVNITSRSGRRFDLRDDVPLEILLRAFSIRTLGARFEEQFKNKPPDDLPAADQQVLLERMMAEARAEALSVAVPIFQHTDSSITTDDLAVFSLEDLMAIVNTFFTLRLGTLSAQSNATENATRIATPTETQAVATQTTAATAMATAAAFNGTTQRGRRLRQAATRRGVTRPM